MTDEEHGPAAAGDLLDAGVALRLEGRVADSEHLVEQQDLRIEVRRDREREPDLHSRRVALDRDVDEVADPGELDDLVELPLRLGARHAEDRPVEKDVVATAELRMEAGSHLEQTADPSVDLGASGARLGDPAQDRQQRRLAGAVGADHAQHLATLNVERDAPQRPHVLSELRRARRDAPARAAMPPVMRTRSLRFVGGACVHTR